MLLHGAHAAAHPSCMHDRSVMGSRLDFGGNKIICSRSRDPADRARRMHSVFCDGSEQQQPRPHLQPPAQSTPEGHAPRPAHACRSMGCCMLRCSLLSLTLALALWPTSGCKNFWLSLDWHSFFTLSDRSRMHRRSRHASDRSIGSRRACPGEHTPSCGY
jgi:hypothetical protein